MPMPPWWDHLLRRTLRLLDLARSGMEGRVEVKAIVEDPGSPDHGQVVAYACNTITLDSRHVLARALAGDPLGAIAAVAWGSGDPDTGITSLPDKTDTALNHEVAVSAVQGGSGVVTSGPNTGDTIVLSPAAYPDDISVVFVSTMPPGVGTDVTFSEVGLKSAEGKLFARFTFPPILKWDKLRLTVSWQIVFVR